MSQAETKTAASLSGRERVKFQGKTIDVSNTKVINENRDRKVYKDPVSGKEVVTTSWLGEHDEPGLLSNEIGQKCDDLNRQHGMTKMPGPGNKGNIPVWQTPFKCDYCDEHFQHLTSDYLTADMRKDGVIPYVDHLREKHLDDLATVWTRELGAAPDTTNAHPLTDLQNQNDELRDELKELKTMMMKFMESKKE